MPATTAAASAPTGLVGYPTNAHQPAWAVHNVRPHLLFFGLTLIDILSQIVYASLAGVFALAALVEWIFWLLAFLYCLFMCLKKAKTWSTRILAILNIIVFTVLRLAFLGVMVATIPLPQAVTQRIPAEYMLYFQLFAFYAFAGLITIPWYFCLYQLIVKHVGRKQRIKDLVNERTAPKTVIVMPCYNEKPEVLMATIDSIVGCDYPASCMHVFLSFDGEATTLDYFSLIQSLGVPLNTVMMDNGSYPKSIDICYRDCRITVSRFPHGGKRHCQKLTFKLIEKVYCEFLKRNDNVFILFIDSDCILDKYCIQNFMWEMELQPGLDEGQMVAMTGVITSHTDQHNVWTVLQDMEYVHGQLFERTVESSLGAVTCLPGALTILRFSAFQKCSKEYFADNTDKMEDMFDFGKCHLGEDRWLTHEFMCKTPGRYRIQMCQSAFCKTEAVAGFWNLLKQRRRWFIGFITNEACMLTDIKLWKRYPLLLILRLAQNTIRTTALLFIIMVISLASGEQTFKELPMGFIAISLCLNWGLMVYLGVRLHRYKVMLYPLMFALNPVLNLFYLIYGCLSAGRKTWGGPRADAAMADEETSPAEAIRQAEEAGDAWNVDPTSFRAVVERKKSLKGQRYKTLPLQPGDPDDDQTPSDQMEDGYFNLASSSNLSLAGPSLDRPRLPFAHRDSMDSVVARDSETLATISPVLVESFMNPDDVHQYHENVLDIRVTKPPGGNEIQQQINQHMVRMGLRKLLPPGEYPFPVAPGTSPSAESRSTLNLPQRDNEKQPSRSNSPGPVDASASPYASLSQPAALGLYRDSSQSLDRYGHPVYPPSHSSFLPAPDSRGSDTGRQGILRNSKDIKIEDIEMAETTLLDEALSRYSGHVDGGGSSLGSRTNTPRTSRVQGRTQRLTANSETPFYGLYADATGPQEGSKAKQAEDKKNAKKEKEKKKGRRLSKTKWLGFGRKDKGGASV